MPAYDEDTDTDGLTQLRAMLEGGLKAPIGETLGFELVEVERGRVVLEGRPDRRVQSTWCGSRGMCGNAAYDACGIAVHSQLEANRGHTTLELKVSYLRGSTRAAARFVQLAAPFRWVAA